MRIPAYYSQLLLLTQNKVMAPTASSTIYSNTIQRVFPHIMSGSIRQKNTDFIVTEIPSVSPVGTGEHVWLKLQKSGENSDWLAGLLARIAQIKRRDVSYAGMKDRHAVTTQWFSVYLPGKTAPNWQEHLPESIQLLEETRHERKLRLGTLKGNHFQIIIRDCHFNKQNDEQQGNTQQIEQRIALIQAQGVPNYFGEQRFGRNFNNLHKAEAWFSGQFTPKKRQLQSIFLSAARSWIFNQILSQRVQQQTWNKAIEGDVFMLSGSKSWFAEPLDTDIVQRVAEKQLSPTAALWGLGELASKQTIQQLEQQIATENPHFVQGLEKHKLRQDRRNLRLFVNDIEAQWLDIHSLQLSFSLPAGSYATTVLDEILTISQ
jgi:tRNA pseudouridine13 synthase